MKKRLHYRKFIDMMDEMEDVDLEFEPEDWEIDYGDYSQHENHLPRRWPAKWVLGMLMLNLILWLTIGAVYLSVKGSQ